MLTEIWPKKGVLCVFVSFILIVKCENIFNETLFELEPVEENTPTDLTGTLFKTVKIYNYSLEEYKDVELLLYGYKAWSFPVQDVSLTIKYPTAEREAVENGNERLITEFLVIVYLDGDLSKAVITSGELREDNVVFTFTSRNVSRLGYKITLYGLPKSETVDRD